MCNSIIVNIILLLFALIYTGDKAVAQTHYELWTKGFHSTGYPNIPADTRWHGVPVTAPENITIHSSAHEGSLAEYIKFIVLSNIFAIFFFFTLPLVEGRSMEIAFKLEPVEFIHVEHMTGKKYNVSPSVPKDIAWRGIIVNAPSEVIVHSEKIKTATRLDIPIPFTSYYCLSKPEVNLVGRSTLVIKNEQTQKEWRGTTSTTDGDRQFHPPAILDDAGSSEAAGAFMNYNITKYISLPVENATYLFWTEVGTMKSNSCRIQVLIQ